MFVMVAGLGKSGISAATLLLNKGNEVLLFDSNKELDSSLILSKFKETEKIRLYLEI